MPKYFKKHLETFINIVLEPVPIEQWNNVVFIGGRRSARDFVGDSRRPFRLLIGKDQSRLVQRVATQHAAHCVADELSHCVSEKERLQVQPRSYRRRSGRRELPIKEIESMRTRQGLSIKPFANAKRRIYLDSRSTACSVTHRQCDLRLSYSSPSKTRPLLWSKLDL